MNYLNLIHKKTRSKERVLSIIISSNIFPGTDPVPKANAE